MAFNFGDDPFNESSEVSKAKQFFGEEDKFKIIGQDPQDLNPSVLDLQNQDVDGKLDDEGDIPNADKQGFFQRLFDRIPDAIAVAISRDPAKTLISLMESRTRYQLEQERAEERGKREVTRKEEHAKGVEIKERELAERERAAKANETMADIAQQALTDYRLLAEEGKSDRHANQMETDMARANLAFTEGIMAQANSKFIAQAQQAGSLAVAQLNATANYNIQTTLANMKDDTERESWRRQSVWALTLAGKGNPNAADDANNIVAKMEHSGMGALTEAEMTLLEAAKSQELTDDDTKKYFMEVSKTAIKTGMATRYTVDAMGNKTFVAGLQGAELLQFAQDGVQAAAQAIGVSAPFNLLGNKAVLSEHEQHLNFFDEYKRTIKTLEPDQAWLLGQNAIRDNLMTQEMFESLKLEEPTGSDLPIGERATKLDEALTAAPQSVGP